MHLASHCHFISGAQQECIIPAITPHWDAHIIIFLFLHEGITTTIVISHCCLIFLVGFLLCVRLHTDTSICLSLLFIHLCISFHNEDSASLSRETKPSRDLPSAAGIRIKKLVQLCIQTKFSVRMKKNVRPIILNNSYTENKYDYSYTENKYDYLCVQVPA